MAGDPIIPLMKPVTSSGSGSPLGSIRSMMRLAGVVFAPGGNPDSKPKSKESDMMVVGDDALHLGPVGVANIRGVRITIPRQVPGSAVDMRAGFSRSQGPGGHQVTGAVVPPATSSISKRTLDATQFVLAGSTLRPATSLISVHSERGFDLRYFSLAASKPALRDDTNGLRFVYGSDSIGSVTLFKEGVDCTKAKEQAEGFIQLLGSPLAEERDQAQKDLNALAKDCPDEVLPLIHDKGKKDPDLSVRRRLNTVLLDSLDWLFWFIIDAARDPDGTLNLDFDRASNFPDRLKKWACLWREVLQMRKLGASDKCLEAIAKADEVLERWCDDPDTASKDKKSVEADWGTLTLLFMLDCVTEEPS